VLLTNFTQPLHGAQLSTKRPYPKGKLPPLKRQESIPTAPAVPQEDSKESKKPVRQQSHAKKDQKIANGKESKQAKKQTTAPNTRNLMMVFDDGNDTGAMIDKFTTGLLQQCAFIIINQQLWQRFKTAPTKTLFTKEWAPDPEEDALSKALGSQTCAETLFTPSEWDVYAADGQDANNEDRFYVFVPHAYVKTQLGNVQQDSDLGINISTLTLIKDPLNTAETKTASENNYQQGTVVTDALNHILCHTSTHPWNVYCIGHGSKGDRSTGKIIGLSIPTFENITLFFNTKVRTNFFFYDTCFAGGQHLAIPFTIEKAPIRLSYPIAAGSISDAPTSSQVALLGSWKSRPQLQIKIHMEALSKTVGKPIHFFTSLNFPAFFKGLEAFASEISGSMDLIYTLNAVGGFLTPDLQKIAFLQNMPHIRMPGTESFQLMHAEKELPIINLTHALINAKNIDARDHSQPWEIDVTGNNIVLLQTSDIAIPLIINTGTKLVPLMPTIPILHATEKTPKDLERQHLVTFTAPLIAHMGLFVTLSTLWYLPKQIQLSDTILLIDTLVCGNDLEDSQQEILSKKTTLQLKQVMIYINTPNPFSPTANNTALLTHGKKAFLIDMDKLATPLAPLSAKATRQYQALYEQYKKYCIDMSLKPLREANQKHLEQYTITKATKALEFMKKELQIRREKRVQEMKSRIISATQHDFLSADVAKNSAALARFKSFLSKNIELAIPVAIETAIAAMQSAHKNVQKNTILLFEALLGENHGVAQAIETGLKGIVSDDATTRKNAQTLFRIIFLKPQHLTYAITMAQADIRAADEDTRNTALTLFNVLFSQGHAFDEALSVVNHNIIATEPYIRRGALELLKTLFKENNDYMPAQAVIKELEKIDNPRSNRRILNELKNVLMWKAAKILTKPTNGSAITEKEEKEKEETPVSSTASTPRQMSSPLTSPAPSPKGNPIIAPPPSAISTPKSEQLVASPASAIASPADQQIVVTNPEIKSSDKGYWTCPTCGVDTKDPEMACVGCGKPKPADS